MNTKICLSTLVLSTLTAVSPAFAQDQLTVAYFQEWPMPFQFAKAEGLYDEALGMPVNWVAFGSGTAMSAAMAAGDVQIAVSQGVLPFISATSAGQDLEIVDVAASYANNENCVVASQLEIDKDSAGELAGKRVALPVGTGAQFTFLKLMEHFNVDPASMTIVDMEPAEGAAAFSQGNVDMACGWGGALTRMTEFGNVLLTGPEKEDIGILSFDLITTTSEFASSQPQLLADFLAVTADMNAEWNAETRREEMLPVIAKDAGMEIEAARATIGDFEFLPADVVLSDKWMGGRVGEYIDGAAQFFFDNGTIPAVLPSYGDLVDLTPMQAVQNR
jgi:taurine transport system substrate-binding protein